ncbi:MAG: cytochrome d ubiquinol oxidase subunit II [Phycisphaerae bacterium]
MDSETLSMIWFLLLGVLLAGYAVLDGFDLGVGILHPFIPQTEDEKRLSMNSIGPLWDGNEVWLVTFGGAMFAMFHEAYATIFSGFYTAFMLLLFALIFRAVSLEFRTKVTQPYRKVWDWGFFIGSFLATLLFGVATGNAILGVPMTAKFEMQIGVLGQLNPYAVAVGLLTVVLFAMHGAIYLYLKTEDDLQERCRKAVWRLYFAFIALFIVVTGWTLFAVPRATQNLADNWWMWAVPVLNVLAIANISRGMALGKERMAFFSSCCAILAFVFLLGVAMFPHMVPGRQVGELGLMADGTVQNLSMFQASSSDLTMKIGLIIVVLGMPCVLAYTAIIYWTFRGKVKLDTHSY